MFKTYSYSPRLEYWDIEYSRVFVESEGFPKNYAKNSALFFEKLVDCRLCGILLAGWDYYR